MPPKSPVRTVAPGIIAISSYAALALLCGETVLIPV